MHKIRSFQDDMRQFLRPKIWSQGTPLGSLGPGSQGALGLGPCRFQILVIWGPNDPPVLVVFHVQAKNLNTVRSWCDIQTFAYQKATFL